MGPALHLPFSIRNQRQRHPCNSNPVGSQWHTPPGGGWRIVAFGHPPPPGILPGCGPSTSPTLLGAADTVRQLLQAGYAVVMSDYQGLGSLDKTHDQADLDTYHPYLDSMTAGYNLIDAVRAARKLFDKANTPPSSASWLAFGMGQGGQAAWAADELAGERGGGTSLCLALSRFPPVADITGLADAAAAGTLNTQQELDLTAFLAGLKSSYPRDFNLEDYRSGVVAQKWDALLACDPAGLEARSAIAAQITPDDLRPKSPAALETLRGFLKKVSLPPQGPTQRRCW